MPRLAIVSLATAGALLVAGTPGLAQSPGVETHVLVRVQAHDAKLIGTSVGGARVTITNAATGEVLASGITAGGTGDTQLIMRTPHVPRADFLATEGAAGFRAGFLLSEPTLVEVTATAPLDFPQATARASTTLLLEPGADIKGNGVVLDLHGLIVEILDGAEGSVADGVAVRARVRMLCSCPTEPGGLWTVERAVARLMDDGVMVAETPLEYSGETSVYTGTVRAPRPGAFTLVVLASDTDGNNVGMAIRAASIR
jgi:hypothetical protein